MADYEHCTNCDDSGWVTVWRLYHRHGYCYIPRDLNNDTREYKPGEPLKMFCVLCGCREMLKRTGETSTRKITGPYYGKRRFCKIDLDPEAWADEASGKWFELQRVSEFDDWNDSF